jgi:branched-chain amino acid transport system permease protein
LAATILIMIILGGTGRLYGAVIGVVIYYILENLTEQVLGTDPPYWELAVGVALVLTVLFARNGILGLFEDVAERLRKKPS